MERTWGRAALDVLSDGNNWRRLGATVTGVGIATLPEWWNYVIVFGSAICPLIGEFLDAVKRRQEGLSA